MLRPVTLADHVGVCDDVKIVTTVQNEPVGVEGLESRMTLVFRVRTMGGVSLNEISRYL